jgi:CRP-like cAMP-binding protein
LDVFEETEQLSRVPLFSKLEKAKLKLIAFTSDRLSLEEKEFLFHKGDHSDSVYLIIQGTLELVLTNIHGEEEVILEQQMNELTGEMGVITNCTRAGSIRAKVPTTVLRIEADVFMSLLSEHFSMSLHVMRLQSARLNASLERETDLLNKAGAC